jgi:NAD(P)H-hydrate epimerase
MMIVSESILKLVYKKRKPWSRKYDFGNILIIGGSKLYPTTPILSGLAAYRAGVDWVTIAAPEEACKIIASYSPNLMVHPLNGEYLADEHVDELLELAKRKTAIAVGGGLTRSENVLQAIIKFLEKLDKPCVIDDDGIYAIARKKEILKNKNFVLTPHSYEFYVLSGIKLSTNLEERIKAVKKVAAELKTTILLKGHVDVISNGREIKLNKTGCETMTKAGLGNTLAGILGAYLARGVDGFIAACAAAYVNGKAGELAARKYSEGILPTDLIEEIPRVIKQVIKY